MSSTFYLECSQCKRSPVCPHRLINNAVGCNVLHDKKNYFCHTPVFENKEDSENGYSFGFRGESLKGE